MKALKEFAWVREHSRVTTLAGSLIYVVDEAEGLSELYALFLKGTGCVVRAYSHRVDVLAALMTHRPGPDLLILDYLGDSMPVERFLLHCLSIHPSLRILMASELSERDVMSSCVKPDRSIQKPFTADEFLREVRAALAE